MNNFYNSINKIYNEIKISKIKKVKEWDEDSYPSIVNFIDKINFISHQFKKKLKKQMKYTQVFNMKNKNVDITIYYTSKSKRTPHKLLRDICSRVLLIKKLGKSNKNKYNITIIPSSFKKKGTNLTGDHINSGATFLKGDYPIVVWRKEEMMKVLTHELIHSLQYDDELYKLSLQGNKEFNFIENKYFLNETYTEIMAEFINLAVSLPQNSNYTVFKSMWNNEIDFSICQAIKVMKLLGFQNFKEMTHSKWKQETNIFNYYILKSAVILNSTAFFKMFCSKGCIIFITQQLAKKFEEYCVKVFYSNKFKKIINNKKCSHTDTLRMTCY